MDQTRFIKQMYIFSLVHGMDRAKDMKDKRHVQVKRGWKKESRTERDYDHYIICIGGSF